MTLGPPGLAVFMADLDFRVIDWSAAAAKTFGIDAEQAVGVTIDRLLCGRADEQQLDAARRAIERDDHYDCVFQFHAPERQPRRFRLWLGRMACLGGDRLNAVVEDISWIDVLERANQNVAKERDRARLYLNVEGVIIVAINSDERVSLINQTGARLLGRPISTITGSNWFDQAVPEAVREGTRTAFAQMMRDEVPVIEYVENPIVAADGTERVIAWHNTILRDETGRPAGSLSSGLDVTDRRLAEHCLAAERERFSKVFLDSAIGMVLCDLQGRFVRVNARFCQITEYDETELQHRTFAEITHPEDVRGDLDLFQRLLVGEIASYELEKRYLQRGGGVIWVHLTVSLLLSDDGHPQLVIGQVQDITSRKRTDELLRREAARATLLRELSEELAAVVSEHQEAFSRVVRRLSETLGDLCLVYLLSPDRTTTQLVAAHHPNGEFVQFLRGADSLPHPANEGINGRVLAAGTELFLPDVDKRQLLEMVRPSLRRALGPFLERIGCRSMLALPLRAQNAVLGTLLMARDGARRRYTDDERTFLQIVADRTAMAVANVRLNVENLRHAALLEQRVQERTQELEEANRELERLATTDSLTGVSNRRSMLAQIEQELVRAKRHGHPLSLLALDLDHFKAINDTHGHQTGDAVLQFVVRTLRRMLRITDIIGRVGGEEFAVLLPETDMAGAVVVAERARAALASAVVPGSADITVTTSIGVVAAIREDDVQSLLRRADKALYRAKREGRNRFEIVLRPSDAPLSPQHVVQLVWNETYECGDPRIDLQHRELFRLGNAALDEAFGTTLQEGRCPRFEALASLAVEHFRDEERMLASIGFPELEAHAELHRSLTEDARAVREAVSVGAGTVLGIVNFVVRRLVAEHMLVADRQFFALLRKVGGETQLYDMPNEVAQQAWLGPEQAVNAAPTPPDAASNAFRVCEAASSAEPDTT